ncbi:type III-A CRISPR-associated CARF protein Csm6 [Selenomonas noxia]|uniref:type III-A CRISPR-associated CARF protein Csm6 n=1 Tax=Selenomonas noxia TaxID=135083 RepID=UPI0028E9820F|nr:hypothetical protein [Selenomonas noxia]
MKRILFSPIGSTDPIKNYHDGACLHIVRHYRPERVVLFFTKEMGNSEKADHRYTTAIKHVDPNCIIEEPIYTDIVDPSRYEAFSQILPQTVQELLQKYPEHEILLNLSSGTPQIKTILAILAADNDRCVGIQTVTPVRAANDHKMIMTAKEIQEIIESNYDNEPGTPSRLEAPPLSVFRYYAEKNRLLALIRSYEYNAALMLAEQSPRVPEEAKVLLRHAVKRVALLPAEAREILSTYRDQELFFFKGYKEESLVEYFLVMQIDQENGHLSNLMLRIVPFLYEFLYEYVRKYARKTLAEVCEKRKNGGIFLVREKLKAAMPGFLARLDKEFYPNYRDQSLSFYLLDHYCSYMQDKKLARNAELHTALLADLEKIRNVRKVRNNVAHEITNVTEEIFRERMNMGSTQMMNIFAHMLCLIYGKNINKIRELYHTINGWLEEALEIHE